MYNRYIPGSNGIYKRQTIEEKKQDAPFMQYSSDSFPATPPVSASEDADARQMANPSGPDLGDFLLLCIILLVLLDAGQDDQLSILITAAALFLIP